MTLRRIQCFRWFLYAALALFAAVPLSASADVQIRSDKGKYKQGGAILLYANIQESGPCVLSTRLPHQTKRKSYDVDAINGQNEISLITRERSRPGRWTLALSCADGGSDSLKAKITGRTGRGSTLIVPAATQIVNITHDGELDEGAIPAEAFPIAADEGGPRPDFRVPFPCGEVWRASTYAAHGQALDWNLAGADGGRPAVVSAPGTVSYLGPLGQWNGGYGNYVVVDHGGGWSTLYAHLRAYNVARGQALGHQAVIGFVGTTGNSTGDHLHFEQRHNGAMQAITKQGGAGVGVGNHRSDNCVSPPPPPPPPVGGMGNAAQLTGDVTGDGRDDAIAFFASTGDWYVAPSTGASFNRNTAAWKWVGNFGQGGATPLLADVTGDGRDDAVVFFASTGDWYVAPSTGASFDRNEAAWKWVSDFGRGATAPLIADVTGDGKADAVAMFPSNGNWYVAPSTGTGFTRDPNSWQWIGDFGTAPNTALQVQVADVTGDGKADAVAMFPSNGNWYVAPSTGTGFSRNPSSWQWTAGFGQATNTALQAPVADVTGDGKADAVAMFPSNGNWYVAPSTGTGFSRDPNSWQWIADFGTGS